MTLREQRNTSRGKDEWGAMAEEETSRVTTCNRKSRIPPTNRLLDLFLGQLTALASI